MDLGELGIPGEVVGEKTVTVWKPKTEGWAEYRGGEMMLSVNAYAIDEGQEGFDLREWTEKKWVFYPDNIPDVGKGAARTYERPHPGGAY